jgi:CheY-like chemotaxis protein
VAEILVVEDDKDLRESLEELLEEQGYVVRTAEHGVAALRYLERNPPPRLVLLDLLMPVMDGWRLRERMLENPKLATVPVVVLSAVAAEYQSEGRLPAEAYLAKPIETERLLQLCSQYCGQRSSSG